MIAIIVLPVLAFLATAAFLWHRAGERRAMISTRERRHRPRSSFIFSARGKRRRPSRRRDGARLPTRQ